MAEESCLFCRVAAGELPANVVAETEGAVAFRDINPQAPTHVLVIPREHIESAAVIGPEHAAMVAELVVTAHRVAVAEGIADGGYRLVFNVGRDAGNTVPHLHLHVLGGRNLGWPPG